MTVEEKPTYCRICEPLCGMIATVTDGRLTALRPDADDPHSKGFCCVKGLSMTQIVNDPDRVTTPLKRVGGPGEFVPCSWDEALDDIAHRLSALRSRLGPTSIAFHEGNPPYFSFAAAMWGKTFAKAIGTPWFYGINSEDGASRVAAFKLLYGHCAHMPIPDIRRTQAMLMLGANPKVSKGSFLHDPHMPQHLREIVERGGRVWVVDPRRTTTAAEFEHVGIRAGTDAWFLLSVLNVLLDRGLYDSEFLDRWTTGFEFWIEAVKAFPPEETERLTGVKADVVVDIAEYIGHARSAVVYGRTGTCTQRFGTLTNVLQDLINIVTGNVQREGGMVWAWSPVAIGPIAEMMKMATFDQVRTRVSGLPDTYGFLPSSALSEEITTPGAGQIRGMVMMGSNPVITGPSGGKLAEALQELEIFAALDFYVNETNRYAHYILPTTTMYEREDSPLHFTNRFVRPSLRVTEKVVDAPGDAREEWVILNDIAKRMGLGGAYGTAIERFVARFGFQATPKMLADLLIRTGSVGDLFGLRRAGWSWKKLARQAPHGVVFHEYLPLSPLKKVIKTADRKIPLAHPTFVTEFVRLQRVRGDGAAEGYPLRMIGMREMTSHNSWMHNASRLMPPGRRHSIRINPVDAAGLGIRDGDLVSVTSPGGEVTTLATVTDEMTQGTIAMPHGWGHTGGWRRAAAAGGATSNLLSSEVERASGSSVLNGIPVRVERVEPQPDSSAHRTAAVADLVRR
ncbi:molybdopterin-containing oxidoreductase family protein [Mycobacterium kiyosense]|uniref:Formate dehydrogenase n=1 Tax=Mycobacterium kiyosense TaxID=2871094 RepID=A0A9P3USS5_9MYCO|nr:molybdopterin-dependent oxidoreductase [Mycobacterium kiyosense]GLB80891.1 formate dehydrogenase [Mycobacterium kiyosense]GLB93371.1 formate dehydrogenase [Mycobacterium kiyosense]GLD28695.1 formate dehydrogenase [Mycobacterium kiyosense]GLD34036.1 formate dehydrogenase [Mycobacterium kiyosense]